MVRTRKIYLAGAIDRKGDNGCKYRSIAEDVCEKLSTPELKLCPVNPYTGEDNIFSKYGIKPDAWESFKFKNWKKAKELANEIRHKDLVQVKSCQAMLVFLDEAVIHGAGTKGEMTVAAQEYKIPIFYVKKLSKKEIRLWMVGCMDPEREEYDTIYEAVLAIQKHFNGGD